MRIQRYVFLASLTLLIGFAQAFPQEPKWAPGLVGRVIVPDDQPAYIAKTTEAGKHLGQIALLIQRQGEVVNTPVYAAWKKDRVNGDVIEINALIKVGMIEFFTYKCRLPGEDTDSIARVAKVKLENGPLRGQVWYTAWFQLDRNLVNGEIAVVSSNTSAVPAAFKRRDLYEFDDAMSDGNDAVARSYLALESVITLKPGTLGKVEEEEENDDVSRQVRIWTGEHTGALVFIDKEHLSQGYDALLKTPPRPSRRSHKPLRQKVKRRPTNLRKV